MGTSRKFKKKSRKRFFSKNRRSRSKYKKNRIFNKKSTRKIRRRRNIRGGGGIWELLWGPSEDEQAEREAALRKAEREAARLESEMERVNLEVKQQVEKKKRDALDALEKKRALNIKKLEMKAMERQREKDTAIKEELKELNIPSIDIYTRIENYNNLKRRSHESPLLEEIDVNFCDFITISYIEHILPFDGTGISESSG